jgi:hypothetical protein
MSEKMTKRDSKSLLARLMAAENLNVEYSETATTAAFDTEGRTLIMPLLKDVSDEATDLFLGHEVGHALYTPQGRIKDIAAEGGMFKNFVNITEDARIEKMIQIKFPGLRRCFYDGYTELIDKNFFGTSDSDVNSYNLIDRLNLHFKGGIRTGVEFSADEATYVTRMENLSTFDDAVDLARDLYDHCKEESENNNPDDSETEETAEGGEGDTGDSGEMSSDMPMEFDEPEDSDDDGESSSGSSGEESEENKNSEEKAESGTSDTADENEENEPTGKNKTSPGKGATDDTVSSSPEDFGPITQDAFDEAVKESVDGETTMKYCRIPSLPLSEIIVPIEEIHSCIDRTIKEEGSPGVGLAKAVTEYKTFSTEQKSLISYLVKEFEMRKSADEHKRTSVGTTGILNPNKLHAYKFSEDIFLRNTVIADGKSHGFIMYIDWSGSMSNCMGKTIDQLMLLALFCKKANIPFDCFAFSNHYWNRDDLPEGERPNRYNRGYYPGKVKELAVQNNFKLLHLLSSQLNNQKFTKAMTYMTYLREGFNSRYSYNETTCYIPDELTLGGTPLNEAVLTAFPMVPLFRKKYNVQIVNTVFLTDGAGAHIRAVHRTPTEDNGLEIDSIDGRGGSKIQITDMVTKKNYNVDKYGDDTGLLLEILKDRTDCRVTGFFINTENRRNLNGNLRGIKPGLTYEEMEEAMDSLKKNQFARMECQGYEEFYVIDGKKMDLEVPDLEITEDMSKAKMKSAFIKNRKAKLVSKKMLSQFAEFVS